MSKKTGLWIIAAAPLAITAAPAAAQQAPGAPPADTAQAPASEGLKDIVVTAQRRAENLQNVPISVAAIDGDKLARSGVSSTLDIAALVPALVLTKTANIAMPYLRGVGTLSATNGIESAVGLYVDGVYLSQPAAGVFDLYNVERVEVLKGPQGTLFGRNSTGGIIQVVTRDPSSSPRANFDAGYGNYDTVSFHGLISGPLTSNLTASAALGGTYRNEGYGYNILLNQKIFTSKALDGQFKLVWTPGGSTRITLSYIYDFLKSYTGSALGVYPGALAENKTRYISQYTVASSIDPYNDSRHHLAYVRIEQDLGWGRLVNITSGQIYKGGVRSNANGIGGPGSTNIYTPIDAHNVSEEIQLQSPSGSRIQAIVGFYFLYDLTRSQLAVSSNLTPLFNVVSSQDTTSYAVFGQATVPMGDHTRLTAGARWTLDRKSITGSRLNGAGAVVTTFAAALGAQGYPTSTTWRNPTWRLSIDHDLSDESMIYASYNRGFKSGLYSLVSQSNPPAEPEKLDAYELGWKNTLLDRRLRLNLAAFYYDYSNIQVRAYQPPITQALIFNAAKSHLYGLDADMEARILPGLTVTGGLSLLHAKYVSFVAGACTIPSPSGGNPTAITCDLSGRRMVRAPKATASLGFSYDHQLANGGGFTFAINDNFNSGYFWDPNNRLTQPAYHLLGGSAQYRLPGDRWSISIWGKNLLDRDIFATASETTTDTYGPGEPRTFGITLAVKFGH